MWFDSKEYPYANGTTTPTLNLTYVEPSLTIETPYPNLPVSIGSTVINTDNNGKAEAFVPWGKYDDHGPECRLHIKRYRAPVFSDGTTIIQPDQAALFQSETT